MSGLDPAELSALLDGELDPARAREVEAMIAADPALAAEFERLKLADGHMRSIAEAAAFRPELRLPEPSPRRSGAWQALPLILIIAGWALGKLAPVAAIALAVNIASLVLFIACLAPLALREARTLETAR